MKNMKNKIQQIILPLCICLTLNTYAQLPGLVITGVADSPTGATWTYSATIGTVVYDLAGLLYKPAGTGSFPAVIINHGTGGDTDVNGYSDKVAKEMVTWGYVTIATNYCHMGTMTFPCGSPGVCSGMTDWGASSNNFLRGLKVWDILASLTYVDTNCIATFGHSRGSFLTTGLAANYPDKFKCAGHTDGGFGIPDQPTMPTLVMANDVIIPYIMHHGELTTQVPIINDDNLDSILIQNGVSHEYHIYLGYIHSDMPHDALVYSRTKTFFNQYICGNTTSINDAHVEELNKINIFPNPANIILTFSTELTGDLNYTIYNLMGQEIKTGNVQSNTIEISELLNGVYFIQLENKDKKCSVQKFIKNSL